MVVALAAASVTGRATLIEFNNLNLAIPDADPSGLVNQQMLNLGDIGTITDINVRLNLAGISGHGFSGDLYAWLKHDTGFSVLLNRPGKTASDAFGYGDNGLNVILDDQAQFDIHTYRDHAAGTFPLSKGLVGTWQPDGRASDPGIVLDSDARTLSLGGFDGMDPNGVWTLFIADLHSGGLVQLSNWALDIRTNAQAVPDSMGTASGLIFGLGLIAVVRRRAGSTRA